MKGIYKKSIKYIQHFFIREAIGHSSHKATQSWLTIIYVSMFMVFMLCCVGVYVFIFSREEVVFTDTSSNSYFSQTQLQNVVERYRNQKQYFSDLRNTPPQKPDTGKIEEVVEEGTETVQEMDAVEEGEEAPIPGM